MVMQEEQYKFHMKRLKYMKPAVDSGLKRPHQLSLIAQVRTYNYLIGKGSTEDELNNVHK